MTPFAAQQGPLIVAHRGGALEAPENTVAAVRRAVAIGSDWQEIDVMLSGDEEVVVFHDKTVDRVAAQPGEVAKLSLEQLRQFRVGAPRLTEGVAAALSVRGVRWDGFDDRYAEERIPTLQEVLAVAGARLMIELKPAGRSEILVTEVVRAIRDAHMHHRVAIASRDADLLWMAYDQEPSLPLIGIVNDLAQLEGILALPISVLAVREDLAVPAMEQAPSGVAVWCWTIYTADHALVLAEMGVHGLITDVPKELLKVFRTPPELFVNP